MFAKYCGIVFGIIAATLFVGIASAGEKEPVAVLELGGASAWNVPEKLLLEEEPKLKKYDEARSFVATVSG